MASFPKPLLRPVSNTVVGPSNRLPVSIDHAINVAFPGAGGHKESGAGFICKRHFGKDFLFPCRPVAKLRRGKGHFLSRRNSGVNGNAGALPISGSADDLFLDRADHGFTNKIFDEVLKAFKSNGFRQERGRYLTLKPVVVEGYVGIRLYLLLVGGGRFTDPGGGRFERQDRGQSRRRGY